MLKNTSETQLQIKTVFVRPSSKKKLSARRKYVQLCLVFCQDFQQSLLLTQNTLKTAAKPTSRQKQFLSGRVIYRNRLADKNKNVNLSFAFLSGFLSAFDQCLIPPIMGIRVVGNPINLTASISCVEFAPEIGDVGMVLEEMRCFMVEPKCLMVEMRCFMVEMTCCMAELTCPMVDKSALWSKRGV
jgi:hypothetical protein